MEEDGLNGLNTSLHNLDRRADGLMWQRNIDRLMPMFNGDGGVLLLMVLLLPMVVLFPFLLVYKIIKHFDNKKAKEEEERKQAAQEKLDQEEIENRNKERANRSRGYAMKILDQIKKEEYDNEDPFYAPCTDEVESIDTENLVLIKNILTSNCHAKTRGALRWLLSLPKDRAANEVGSKVNVEIAKRLYYDETGEDLSEEAVEKLNHQIGDDYNG